MKTQVAIEPLHDRDITLSEADFRLFIPADLFEKAEGRHLSYGVRGMGDD